MKLLFILLQMTIMTYNVENLFDTVHDENKNDYEFLPQSERHWTRQRYFRKVDNVMKAIVAAGETGELPLIVGLCEIENDYVLRTMTKSRPYSRLGYDYVHYESPDARGIDVALLYRTDLFMPLGSRPVQVKIGEKHTRDILYMCGMLRGGTILHVIETHFPSRRGGAVPSEVNRVDAARELRAIVDSVFRINPEAAIIIMGDFNENPDDEATATVLRAMPMGASAYDSSELYNLTWDGYPSADLRQGSYWFSNHWEQLDQIIVSGALLNGTCPLQLSHKAELFRPAWLKDKAGHPIRTYQGPVYKGGVSDHFPVTVKSRKGEH